MFARACDYADRACDYAERERCGCHKYLLKYATTAAIVARLPLLFSPSYHYDASTFFFPPFPEIESNLNRRAGRIPMEFDTHGNYNGKLLDCPIHRVLPEKITGSPSCNSSSRALVCLLTPVSPCSV